ncbi:MAG: D-sedoheptulose 7-phosphate isomerase [Candidatus Omnitrophica bacterium]|nr:D-sedoheptulose 7-phosphate isomerase [Candidatus Omnitrophota bacterium]
MKERIQKIFQESMDVKKKTLEQNLDQILKAVNEIIAAFRRDNKIFLFGNGGSAADSQHIAAEFIGRFQKERRSWPAIALTTDTSALTALGNDYGFERVFARQLEGLGRKGDFAIGISTSGNSPNVLAGVEMAKKMGIKTLALTGGNGGKLAAFADIAIIVPSSVTARIQESHICIAHSICELVEEQLS